MSDNNKWPLPACLHEAGHCVARWYLGATTESAEVFDEAGARYGIAVGVDDGRRFLSSGRSVGKALMFATSLDLQIQASQEVIDSYRRIGTARAEMQLVSVVAGAVAEARHGGSDLVACWQKAQADQEIAYRVGLSWLPDIEAAVVVAFGRADALMHSAAAWASVEAIAERLKRDGSIDHRGIDAACEEAFRRQQPSLFDWNDRWPVDLERLHDGWLPPDHQAEDGLGEDVREG